MSMVNKMKVLLLVALLVLGCSGELLDGFQHNSKRFYYKERIKATLKLLEERCPQTLIQQPNLHMKREILNSEMSLLLEQRHFDRVLAALSKCLQKTTLKQLPSTRKTIKTRPTTHPTTTRVLTTRTIPEMTTTRVLTTRTIPEMTTTSGIPVPAECRSSSVRNLTESWRNGGSGKGDDHKILDTGKIWFRFTGAAGRMLRNTCPGQKDCGSTGAHWSDDAMPTVIGQVKSINIYQSYWNSGDVAERCKTDSVRTSVIRCSAEKGDFIYRIDESLSSGKDTVCGMDV